MEAPVEVLRSPPFARQGRAGLRGAGGFFGTGLHVSVDFPAGGRIRVPAGFGKPAVSERTIGSWGGQNLGCDREGRGYRPDKPNYFQSFTVRNA